MRKQLLSIVLVALMVIGAASFVAPTAAFAADTVGYVNMGMAFNAHPDTSGARAAFELEDQKAQKEFESKIKGLDEKGAMALRQSLVERVQKRQRELFEPINKKIMAAVKKVAAANGCTVIVDASVVVDGGRDLTKEVIASFGR